MDEKWKDINGYEGLYKISNFGRVMSMDRYVENKNPKLYGRGRHISTKVLKCSIHKKTGYVKVILCKNKIKKHFNVHRLVALAFISNENNFNCVNHIDENKLNNNSRNLEWCSYSYNSNYGKMNNKTKLTRRTIVIQMSKTGEILKRWNSILEIINCTDHNKNNILKCCKKERKTHHGYKWEFEL